MAVGLYYRVVRVSIWVLVVVAFFVGFGAFFALRGPSGGGVVVREVGVDWDLVGRISEASSSKEQAEVRAGKVEALVSKLQDTAVRKEQERKLGSLYLEAGQAALAGKDLVKAEKDMLRAAELDPGNSAALVALAKLYGGFSRMEAPLETRVPLFEKSAGWWRKAADAVTDAKAKSDCFASAASVYYDLATELAAAADYQKADVACRKGLEFAARDSDEYKELAALRARLGMSR
jgi:tetratricopeptide (TPR) repeat protein